MTRQRNSYWPIGGHLKCEWLHCYAGMGIAGSGVCFLGGMWWHPSCPAFIDEEEEIGNREKEMLNVRDRKEHK